MEELKAQQDLLNPFLPCTIAYPILLIGKGFSRVQIGLNTINNLSL